MISISVFDRIFIFAFGTIYLSVALFAWLYPAYVLFQLIIKREFRKIILLLPLVVIILLGVYYSWISFLEYSPRGGSLSLTLMIVVGLIVSVYSFKIYKRHTVKGIFKFLLLILIILFSYFCINTLIFDH